MIAALLLATILDDHAAAMASSKLKYIAVDREVKDAVNPPSCIGPRPDRRVISVKGEKQYAPWPKNKELDKHLIAGAIAMRDKNVDAQVKEAQAAIAIDGNDPRVWVLRAAAAWAQKDALGMKLAIQNAVRLAPWFSPAHLIAADASIHMGEPDEVIEAFTDLLTYDPQSLMWRDVFLAYAQEQHITLHAYPFRPPHGLVGARHRGTVEIYDDPEWRVYGNCKAVWRYEDAYRRARLGNDRPYEWTVEEERECVTAYVLGNLEEAKTKLPAGAPNRDVINALPPLAQHILIATDAGLLDGFIIYAVVGQRCPAAVPLLPDDVLAKEHDYIKRFIVLKKQ